jgi:hypothetical protein
MGNKETRETTIEKFGEDDYVVTWWDGSANHYKRLFDALESIKNDFIFNTEKEVKENLKKYNAESIINIFKKPESYFERYESYKDIKDLQKILSVYKINECIPVQFLEAENCGKCHTEIYREWKTSTHAHALSDLQFQAELSKPAQPKWICLNCHIPVQNQREAIIETLKNGDFLKPIEIKNINFDEIMK